MLKDLMFWRNKKKVNKISGQLFKEEVLNVITHLISVFLFSFLSGMFLLSTKFKFFNIIFCLTIVNTYSCSVLYHYFEKPSIKEKLKILDHISISLLIAGSYTPYMILTQNHILLSIVWTLTISNIFEMLYFWQVNRYILIKYLIMGWMALFSIKSLFLILPFWSFILFILGGISYTIGTYFFKRDQRHYYYHTIWHVFVTIGTLFHLISVWIATIN